jgi:hypothetical protein
MKKELSKKTTRRIVLNRETLRQLEARELQDVAGQDPKPKPTGPTCSGHLPCTC